MQASGVGICKSLVLLMFVSILEVIFCFIGVSGVFVKIGKPNPNPKL